MITPLLEKALIKGVAKYHTFMMAYTGVAKLVVPTGHKFIITDVTINPFSEVKTIDDLQSFSSIDAHSTHLYDFHSDSDRNSFLVKNLFDIKYTALGTVVQYIKNSEPVHFDTFMIHSKDIYITILAAFGVSGFTDKTFAPLTDTQCPLAPISYGKTIPVLKMLRDITTAQYIPTSPTDSSITPTSTMSNQPFTRADGNSALADPTIVGLNYPTSLLNVGYVSINENELNKLITNG